MIDKSAINAGFRIFNKTPDTLLGLKLLHMLGKMQRFNRPKNLSIEKIQIPSDDIGRTIPALVVRPNGKNGSLPIILQCHGGGYAIGTPWQDLPLIEKLMAASSAIFVIPDYRLSTIAAFPAGLNDCMNTIMWAHNRSSELGGDPRRLFVMGQSSGGGIAASLCLKLRGSKDIQIAGQFICYAMLDDRAEKWTSLPAEEVTWSRQKNQLAWKMYLNGMSATEFAAPARAQDLAKLPPAIGFVGTHDLFRNENTDYFARLSKAGVKTNFKLIEGGYHGVEIFAPKSRAGQAAWDFLLGAYAEMIEN